MGTSIIVNSIQDGVVFGWCGQIGPQGKLVAFLTLRFNNLSRTGQMYERRLIFMHEFLEWLGVIFLCILLTFAVISIYYALCEWFDNLKRDYIIKHRFDKSPTAKCFCRDCIHHDDETKRCYRFGETTKEYRCTADYWFCWEAEPREEIEE
jgi:hypothetical protein